MRQRYSIIATSGTAFDHRRSANVLQVRFRLRLVFFGQTSCREFLSSSACRPWSGSVRTAQPSPRPVWSPRAGSNGRSECCRALREAKRGMSAEVLVTVSRIAAFCIDLKKALASSQVCIRAAQGLGLLLSCFDGIGRRSARHDQHDRLHLVFETLGVGFLLVATFFLDVFGRRPFRRPGGFPCSGRGPGWSRPCRPSCATFSVSGRMPWLSSDFVS